VKAFRWSRNRQQTQCQRPELTRLAGECPSAGSRLHGRAEIGGRPIRSFREFSSSIVRHNLFRFAALLIYAEIASAAGCSRACCRTNRLTSTAVTDHSRHTTDASIADPFGERPRPQFSTSKILLGGLFRFDCDSQALLNLVELAYASLPQHLLSTSAAIAEFRVELRLNARNTDTKAIEPPPVRTQSGTGLLCGVMDASNYTIVTPEQHRALVVVTQDMLAFAYHVRYELIEFAVFTLAARGLGLVPLHGACIGLQGRGLLLLGASGSGKSTSTLHGLLSGLQLLSEDAVFFHPESGLATGVANFLHVRADALRFVDDETTANWIRNSPVIRRRSGIEKFEVDLRQRQGVFAAQPLRLTGVVIVSSRPADEPENLLRVLPADEALSRIRADQPYAAGQPNWLRFEQWVERGNVFELRRAHHPQVGVDALQALMH
jgi:hypothetical protein